jgi:hypothetical protein
MIDAIRSDTVNEPGETDAGVGWRICGKPLNAIRIRQIVYVSFSVQTYQNFRLLSKLTNLRFVILTLRPSVHPKRIL